MQGVVTPITPKKPAGELGPGPASDLRLPPVRKDLGAIHEARVGGSKKESNLGDLLLLANPLKRNPRGEVIEHTLPLERIGR